MLSKQVTVGQARNGKQMSTKLNCRKQISTELDELPAQRSDISRKLSLSLDDDVHLD